MFFFFFLHMFNSPLLEKYMYNVDNDTIIMALFQICKFNLRTN